MSTYHCVDHRQYGETDVWDEEDNCVATTFDSAMADRVAKALEILDRIEALPAGSEQSITFYATGAE